MFLLLFSQPIMFFFSVLVNRELECGPLDASLTNIQWLGRMNTCAFEPDPAKQMADKENQDPNSQTFQVSCPLLAPQCGCYC